MCVRALSPLFDWVACVFRKAAPLSLLSPPPLTLYSLPVLLGPVQAATYALNYGALAATLGAAWAIGTPWPLAWAAGTAVRVGGTAGYVALTGWTLGEDLWALLLGNVAALVDQVSSIAGTAGAPSQAAIAATLGGVLAVNAAAHVGMLTVVGAAALKGAGLRPPRLPRRVAVAVWGRAAVEGMEGKV